MGFVSARSDGERQVVVYTTEGGGEYPIHGAYYTGDPEHGWICMQWKRDGTLLNNGKSSALDIVKAINEGKIVLSPRQEATRPKEQIQVEAGRTIRPDDAGEGPPLSV